MALAKVDYDAQMAEETFTQLRSELQGGRPARGHDAVASVLFVGIYAQIACAHALERIAKALEDVGAGHDAAKAGQALSSGAKHTYKS